MFLIFNFSSCETALCILYTILDLNQSLAQRPVDDLPAGSYIMADTDANQQYLADSLPSPAVITSMLNCLLSSPRCKDATPPLENCIKTIPSMITTTGAAPADQDSTAVSPEPPTTSVETSAALAETNENGGDVMSSHSKSNNNDSKLQQPHLRTIFSIHQLKIRTLKLMFVSNVTFSILKSCLNSSAKRHRTFYALAAAVVRDFDPANDLCAKFCAEFVRYLTDLCPVAETESLDGESGGYRKLSLAELAWLLDFPQECIQYSNNIIIF